MPFSAVVGAVQLDPLKVTAPVWDTTAQNVEEVQEMPPGQPPSASEVGVVQEEPLKSNTFTFWSIAAQKVVVGQETDPRPEALSIFVGSVQVAPL